MTRMVALRVPLGEDLAALSGLLREYGVAHQVTEEKGEQVVWVLSAEHGQQVAELYSRLQRGELNIVMAPGQPPRRVSRWEQLRERPMVVVLLLLSLAGTLLVGADRQFSVVQHLSFYALDIRAGLVVPEWPTGQFWRLLTPMFLHFGILHFVFNGLWLWELGGMIEARQGSARLLGVVLLIGAGSNMAQAMAGVSVFGGMSGVIYGLLGYILAWNHLCPEYPFPLVKGVAVVLLVWLLICAAGITSLLGLGQIANTAHISGLLLGLVLGAAAALIARRAN